MSTMKTPSETDVTEQPKRVALVSMQRGVRCVMCNQKAITTAAHIPVCQKHWDEYKNEAKQYPAQRPVFWAMQAAAKAANAELNDRRNQSES